MRRRIAEYTVSGSIITLQEKVDIQDVRLIFDETTKDCVCSSSQKDKIFIPSLSGGKTIMILDGVPRTNHELTIEIDNGGSLEVVGDTILEAIEGVKDSQYRPEYATDQDIINLFQ